MFIERILRERGGREERERREEKFNVFFI